MGKESAKKMFEWYAQVALKNLEEHQKKHPDFKIFKDCKDRKEFEDYILNVFIAYYGLRCTCDDAQEWEFNNALGHYHQCDLWKFSFAIQRALDWAEVRLHVPLDIDKTEGGRASSQQ